MKHFTVAAAARASKRSASTINRLIRSGALKAERKGRANIIPAESKDALVALIHEHVPYTKRRRSASSLPLILKLAALPEETRELLLSLSERYTNAELRLLLEL